MRDRGYKRVVLFGHSAGGSLMDYYQNVAEHGNSAFKQGMTLSGFRGFFDSNGNERRLPAADALITAASTIGTSASFLLRLDGSVLDETTASRNPALDMFNPANGFNPATGTGSYNAAFLASYHNAQCDRMNRLIDSVQDQLDNIAAGNGQFTDNDFIIIPGRPREPSECRSLPRSLHHNAVYFTSQRRQKDCQQYSPCRGQLSEEPRCRWISLADPCLVS